MEYLPLFIDLKGKSVLVVGGGDVAVRKIELLKKTGAIVKIVAHILCVKLLNMLSDPNVNWIGKNFKSTMLDAVVLVVVATNNANVNDFVYQNAKKRHILINTVDDKNKCSCIFPSIVDRTPILIGISSSGTAPVLARILREKFELLLPESFGLVAKLVGKWRYQVKKRIKNVICRRRFWEKIFYGGYISMLVERGRMKEANKILRNLIDTVDHCYTKKGSVTLVGAGPGDRELLTIKGLRMIQQADVILYDYLVNVHVLELARRDANKICVGKCAGKHLMSQENINSFMVQLARQGHRVVRLKGGDPFIFGRGGEELQVLSTSNVPFQVVPGITAGIGVAAYAGIPLTHRKYAHSVTFIAGNCANNSELNWSNLSDNQQTLVIYMGKINVVNISKNLISHGRSACTPVALISRGTYKNQNIVIGNLIELENLTNMTSNPTILIIGDVVSLHKEINWFGKEKLNYY